MFPYFGSHLSVLLSLALSQPLLDLGESARDVLVRSLAMKHRVSVTMIQIQPGSSGVSKHGDRDSDAVHTKLQMSSDGKVRRTVLQPLRMQGIVSIDDGKSWMTLMPDHRQVMIQDSPMLFKQDVRERIALIDQNYEVRFDKRASIAGRPVRIVQAVPRAKELPSKRFHIDDETYVILKQEIIESSGRERVLFDTLMVTYPPRQDSSLYRRPSNYKVVRCEAPKRVSNPESIKGRVGFEPRSPEDLPYGFVIVEWNLLGEEHAPFLGARLSDGLSYATVYQWDASKRSGKSFNGGSGVVIDGIGISVMGDIPRSVRTKIVEVFRRAGTRP